MRSPHQGLVLFGLCLSTTLASAGYAAEVTVENYANTDIFVCLAYNRGGTVSSGWTRIAPNDKKVFTNDTQDEMYLRVQGNNQGEITFSNFNKFLFFPVNDQRFVVGNEPDDPSVRRFQWGQNLEFSVNKTRNEPLPDGWQSKRFFSVGAGNDRLEVRP